MAIKVLAENWAHDVNVRERFAEEARVLWRLDSDRAIRVHLVDELDDGRPYFVMDYADRGSLGDRMAERARRRARSTRWMKRSRTVDRDRRRGSRWSTGSASCTAT